MKIAHKHIGVVTNDGMIWCEIHDKWEKFLQKDKKRKVRGVK